MGKSKSVAEMTYKTETVAITELKPHPRNYRNHGDDQLDHIVESIQEHGLYRNVVIAKEGTILAGHGVVLAARKTGITELPVYRVDVDPNEPRALKILTGDNEISRLAYIDDRLLTEVLKEIKDEDPIGLLGTGYDEQMLAALAFVTRNQSEIEDFDAAKEWVGMPDFDPGTEEYMLVVSCRAVEDVSDLLALIGTTREDVRKNKKGTVYSMRWPLEDQNDLKSLKFMQDESGQ